MSCRYHLWQTAYHWVMCSTHATDALAHHLTCKERNVLSLQTEILKDIIVHSFNLVRPVLLTSVRTSLMQEYSLYHTLMLSTEGTVDETDIRQIVIVCSDTLEPVWLVDDGRRVLRLHQMLNAATSDSDMNNADTY